MEALPIVDPDVIDEDAKLFIQKQSLREKRIHFGFDLRINSKNTPESLDELEDRVRKNQDIPMSEYEKKWGFTYDELQTATKVVSILYANPSLFVADPHLAQTRLYTMVSRDRKSKRENISAMKAILNEEKSRKKKEKRLQDIATIQKTTMKKERDDALAALIYSPNDNMISDSSKKKFILDGNSIDSSCEKKKKEGKNCSEKENIVDDLSALNIFQIRCKAGIEILETIFDPKRFLPLITDDSEESNCLDSLKKTDVTNPDIIAWRCFLTALYYRFWPILEYNTQMVSSLISESYSISFDLNDFIRGFEPFIHQSSSRLILFLSSTLIVDKNEGPVFSTLRYRQSLLFESNSEKYIHDFSIHGLWNQREHEEVFNLAFFGAFRDEKNVDDAPKKSFLFFSSRQAFERLLTLDIPFEYSCDISSLRKKIINFVENKNMGCKYTVFQALSNLLKKLKNILALKKLFGIHGDVVTETVNALSYLFCIREETDTETKKNNAAIALFKVWLSILRLYDYLTRYFIMSYLIIVNGKCRELEEFMSSLFFDNQIYLTVSDIAMNLYAYFIYVPNLSKKPSEKDVKLFDGKKVMLPIIPPEAGLDLKNISEDNIIDVNLDNNLLNEKGFINIDHCTIDFPYSDAMVYSKLYYEEALQHSIYMNSVNLDLKLRMNKLQKCHICKGKYYLLHPYYYSLCHKCGEFNYNKRLMTRDLKGKVVLLTGCRIKIGYAMALSLLRCGAILIGTTRFSFDALSRFITEPDYSEWKDRLYLFSLDLRDMSLVMQFCDFISSKFKKIFAIINNAAQTIARKPSYTRELRASEVNPPQALSERFAENSLSSEWHIYFSHNCKVDIGYSWAFEYENKSTISHADPANYLFLPCSQNSMISKCDEFSHDKNDRRKAYLNEIDSDLFSIMRPFDRYDSQAENCDKRSKNSWTMNLAEVSGHEAAEVMAINALSPLIINSKLKPLLMNREEVDNKFKLNKKGNDDSKNQDIYVSKRASFIINVSAMEGQFYRFKQTTHPHTNMAKAALNMMTRTSADDYAKDGIYMNSVDTGWITDESPTEKKNRRLEGFQLCPLDEVDAAARCLDLIYTDSRQYGKFWKNFKVIPW